jgi:hypothetical protein
MKRSTVLVVLSLLLLAGAPATVAGQDSQGEGVTLNYFTATANYPNYVLLEWESANELATQAYRIKRGVTPDPAQAVVIIPYIPAHPGSPLGYYYSVQDANGLVDGMTYYYWIEDEALGQPGNWIAHLEYNPFVRWGWVCSIYDLDCNQIVEALDIAAVALHWNCVSPAPCYDERFDLDGDDRVDVVDVVLDAARWGCELGDACYG